MPIGEQLIVIGAGVVLALVFVAVGAARLAVTALALKKRLDALKELPILATVAATQKRLETTQRNVESIERLVERARRAIADIEDAGNRVLLLGRTVIVVGTAALAIFGGFAPNGKRSAR